MLFHIIRNIYIINRYWRPFNGSYINHFTPIYSTNLYFYQICHIYHQVVSKSKLNECGDHNIIEIIDVDEYKSDGSVNNIKNKL